MQHATAMPVLPTHQGLGLGLHLSLGLSLGLVARAMLPTHPARGGPWRPVDGSTPGDAAALAAGLDAGGRGDRLRVDGAAALGAADGARGAAAGGAPVPAEPEGRAPGTGDGRTDLRGAHHCNAIRIQ